MKLIVILIAVLLLHGTAVAQDLTVYPARNQGSEQMEKDKFECYSWAKGQTGFDPTATPQAAASKAPKKNVAGGAVSGGARGAAVGTGIGAITGGGSGAAKGAARGAMFGGAFGGLRSKSQNKQAKEAQKQSQQMQSAQYEQERATYTRAYGACLEGRGYTVK